MPIRGFILQATYRIEARRPVVHLYGRLENGDPFLVRDDREIPHFYVASRHRSRARQLDARSLVPSRFRAMDGTPLVRVNLRIPSDTPALRDRLIDHRIPCFEADIPFATRFLINHGIRGALQIDGDGRRVPGLGWVYRNPNLAPANWTPRLSILSLDIETDPGGKTVFSVALHGCGTSEVLLLDPDGGESAGGAVCFRREEEFLRAFCGRVRELDPDVLTGWNVVDFDLRVLDRLSRSCGVPLQLGRVREPMRLRPSRSPWANLEARIPGRVVADGIHVLRGSFVRLQRYSLDFAARQVLGEGKTLHGADRPAEIMESFHNDRERFVLYNRTDARLALEILEKLKLMDLAVERSRLTGLPIDRVSGSIAAFDFRYLTELHKRRIAAPSVGAVSSPGSSPGGHVLEPDPGLYEQVLVFDFKSLYPSLIRTFQIDPLGYLPQPRPDQDPIVAPNGASFRREPGVLTQLLNHLFPRREAAKAAGDQVASHAIKILMNSFYGVLGTPACRFYRPELAAAITTFGREILLWSRDRFRQYGFRVIYGDTDSLFVLSGEQTTAEAQARGEELARRLNRDLESHVLEKWRVNSRLELEMERLYRKFFIPATRQGGRGARKRYVGFVGDGPGSEVVFTGMEVVRSDWTELARRVQKELYRKLFTEEDARPYLRDTVARLRAGRLDHLLVYSKMLGKPLKEYRSTTPPHVAAARKMAGKPGRRISYLMTLAGPEPAGETTADIDREHYVRKQVRPVAQPVLGHLGLKFEKVIGDDRQLELF